ncbi:hypothetical protein MED222_05625 [Vibrio sp. MED222]|nr:hypothetical protein MED222_05625 [Vibrio sp. MED222]
MTAAYVVSNVIRRTATSTALSSG